MEDTITAANSNDGGKQDSRSPLSIVQSGAHEKQNPWYSEGLRFHCTGCGKCCTGFPGAVWVSDEEVQKIAEYLHESIESVQEKYTRLIGMNERRSLQEVGKSYDCIFLQNKKFCRIYGARPQQCRTYPWWPSVVESPEAWEDAKSMCEGIEHPEAPLVPREVIEKSLQGNEQ